MPTASPRASRSSSSFGPSPASIAALAHTDGRNGPGASDAAELLDHHGQLGEAVALAPDRLGQVEPEPAEAGQLVPERRRRSSASASTAARTTAGAMRSAVKRRAVSRSAWWSSPMAMLTCPSPWLPG